MADTMQAWDGWAEGSWGSGTWGVITATSEGPGSNTSVPYWVDPPKPKKPRRKGQVPVTYERELLIASAALFDEDRP